MPIKTVVLFGGSRDTQPYVEPLRNIKDLNIREIRDGSQALSLIWQPNCVVVVTTTHTMGWNFAELISMIVSHEVPVIFLYENDTEKTLAQATGAILVFKGKVDELSQQVQHPTKPKSLPPWR